MARKQWIERKRSGKGFRYTYNDIPLTDPHEKAYIRSLRIPPAWQDVRIARSTRAKIRAMGIDAAGRRQYIYHPAFRAKQEQAKFDRLLRFARALPRMRQTTQKHLGRPKLDQQKVVACIVQLMDRAYFRVGNDTYAKTNKSYGITTVRSKHTTVEGPTITFDFIGKSGQRHTKRITDHTLARVVRQLDELPGREVFKYYATPTELRTVHSSEVNAYIKACMGEECTAKDFRTWGGTCQAITELTQCERAASERERKKTITACVKKVARKLGNTPAIARSSYIDPRVLAMYLEGDDLHRIATEVDAWKAQPYFSRDEQRALAVLVYAAT